MLSGSRSSPGLVEPQGCTRPAPTRPLGSTPPPPGAPETSDRDERTKVVPGAAGLGQGRLGRCPERGHSSGRRRREPRERPRPHQSHSSPNAGLTGARAAPGGSCTHSRRSPQARSGLLGQSGSPGPAPPPGMMNRMHSGCAAASPPAARTSGASPSSWKPVSPRKAHPAPAHPGTGHGRPCPSREASKTTRARSRGVTGAPEQAHRPEGRRLESPRALPGRAPQGLRRRGSWMQPGTWPKARGAGLRARVSTVGDGGQETRPQAPLSQGAEPSWACFPQRLLQSPWGLLDGRGQAGDPAAKGEQGELTGGDSGDGQDTSPALVPKDVAACALPMPESTPTAHPGRVQPVGRGHPVCLLNRPDTGLENENTASLPECLHRLITRLSLRI